MFARVLLQSLLLLGVLGLGTLWEMVRIENSDYEVYQTLVASSDPSSGSEDFELEVIQTRGKSSKEAWWSRGQQRLHFHLSSEHSELVFSQQGQESQTMEHLNDVHCAMQEALFFRLPDGKEVLYKNTNWIYKEATKEKVDPQLVHSLIPMQQIRTFDADHAIYDYRTQNFTAEHVNLARFTAPGQVLLFPQPVTDRIMSGLAQSIQFSVNDRNPNFQAQHLKATFFSNKGTL